MDLGSFPVVSVLFLVANLAWAEDWPQWRGPYFNGSTSEQGLPSDWSMTKNIAWSADLPGAAASTPIVWKTRVLLSGVDALSGHDLATGKELWRWADWNPSRSPNWPLIASPVAGAGLVLVCVPKGQPVYAVKPELSGVLDDRALAWTSRGTRGVTSEVPTPAVYDGDFFVLSDSRNCLSRVAARTGQVIWTVRTPGTAKYEASPLVADGKVYLINLDGQAAVLGAANGEVLRVIPMDQPVAGEMVRSSIIAAHGQLFIRTTRKLYCVGKGR